MSETLLQQVAEAIERHQLLNKGDRVVVGVSGGMDSMVLLHVLHAFRESLRLELIVAHVNHGLRPAESEKEAELVERESRRLGYPVRVWAIRCERVSERVRLFPSGRCP